MHSAPQRYGFEYHKLHDMPGLVSWITGVEAEEEQDHQIHIYIFLYDP